MHMSTGAGPTTCFKCGSPVQPEHRFCPACGVALLGAAPAAPAARTGLEQLGSDASLQSHWVRRLVAVVIDALVVGALLALIFVLVWVPFAIGAALAGGRVAFLDLPFFFSPFGFFFTFPFVAGALYLLHFAFAESRYGVTLGKCLMGLRVETVSGGDVPLDKAFIRNLSKLHWLLLLLDVIVGLATPGDARQKFTDRFAGTRVVSTR
jgi:uncharacterized RDD family membrane protein YckC